MGTQPRERRGDGRQLPPVHSNRPAAAQNLNVPAPNSWSRRNFRKGMKQNCQSPRHPTLVGAVSLGHVPRSGLPWPFQELSVKVIVSIRPVLMLPLLPLATSRAHGSHHTSSLSDSRHRSHVMGINTWVGNTAWSSREPKSAGLFSWFLGCSQYFPIWPVWGYF